MDWLYTLSGFAVGAIVGLTGVGGGSLMTPLLVLLFGIHPATAVGTDLLYAAITKSGGTIVHGRKGHIDWQIVGRLAAGSIPASAITILILSQLPKRSAEVTHLISVSLGIALLLTACAIIFRKRILEFALQHDDSFVQRHLGAVTVAVGAVLGVLVSISSVGAGAVGVTVLLLLYPRLPMASIVGSDIAHAVPLTLVAGIGHWALGDVDWALMGVLLMGSLPGIIVGSYSATRVPETVLRLTLASVLFVVAGKIMFAELNLSSAFVTALAWTH